VDLLGNINHKSAILDVGCGEGYFLNYVYSKKKCKVLGIDYSDFGIKKHNPEMLNFFIKGDIYGIQKKLIIEGKKFNVIMLKNVLEHVLEPEFLINQISMLLAKDGKLIITVPNDFSWLQQAYEQDALINRRYWVSPLEHLNYFTKTSLVELLSFYSFSLLHTLGDFPIEWFIINEHSNYVNNPEKGHAAHKARLYLENRINEVDLDLAKNFWKSIGELGLGRTVTVIAQKAS
jgi:SAM-dependent methyltransferase